MSTFGLPAPRITGSRFFPQQKINVVPRNRIPPKPHLWLEAFFPFPAVHVEYIYGLFAGSRGCVPVDEFADEVCRQFGVDRIALTSRDQTKSYVAARGAVAKELHRRGWALARIGEYLGGRDHTSVSNLLGNTKRSAKRLEEKREKYAKRAKEA